MPNCFIMITIYRNEIIRKFLLVDKVWYHFSNNCVFDLVSRLNLMHSDILDYSNHDYQNGIMHHFIQLISFKYSHFRQITLYNETQRDPIIMQS